MFGAGPLAAYVAYQIVKGDPTRYYWIIVLTIAELYGGYVFPPPPAGPMLNDNDARALAFLDG